MPPVLIFIRHAEAEHNVGGRYDIPDPILSEHGLHQCAELQDYLQDNLPIARKIQLIVTSPFRRTLQTTTLALDWLVKKGVPIVPRAEWQENSTKPCDTGSEVEVISREYPNIDFSSLDAIYPAKTGPYAYTREAVLQRGRDGLAWLKARPESYIAIVTHSAFLRTSVAHRRFANADYRVFRFWDASEGLDLVELSGEAGGMGRSAIGEAGIDQWDFKM